MNKQVLALTNNGMNAILCVGDPKEVSDAHNSVSYILNQVEQDIKGVLIDNLPNVIIAYEPVYAIGQADPIAVGTVEAVIKEIRTKIKDLYNEAAANSIRIVYGGSINSANYNNYISSEQIDGLLIGRSSLDVTSFYDIAYGTSQIIAQNYPSLGNKYYVLKQKEIAATNKPLPDPRHHVKDLNAKEASPDPNAHLKQQPTSEQPNLSANTTQD
ncbi:triose-phosphate isomerase [bacterium]|nr:triose-phosphate isomerase [bacterium]